jgi:hypothetical protein
VEQGRTEIKEGKTLSKKNYVLSQEQKESLIGILLADGFLVKAKPEHNTRLRIDHTYPSQEAYVISIYTLFKSMVNMEPTILERKADIRTQVGKIYKSIYFWTLSFPCFNPYYDFFYNGKTKILPLNIEELLTARGLANHGRWLLYDI